MNSYFEKRARTYANKSSKGLWSILKKQELRAVEKLLAPEKNKKLIEFGCGTGFYSLYFKTKYSLNVLGVDNSPGMLEVANTQGISTVNLSLENLPELGKFDYALAAGVLEFIESPETVFGNFAQCLPLNGKVVLLIPAQGVMGFLYKIYHEFFGCSVFIRSREEYTRLAEKNGFVKTGELKATPISEVLVYRKNLSGN